MCSVVPVEALKKSTWLKVVQTESGLVLGIPINVVHRNGAHYHPSSLTEEPTVLSDEIFRTGDQIKAMDAFNEFQAGWAMVLKTPVLEEIKPGILRKRYIP